MMEPSSSQIAELESLAQEHFQQGRLAEAREDFEHLCRQCPQEPRVWHRLCVVYGALGDPENALRCARQTTLLAPLVIAGYRNLGHFQLQLDHAAEAETAFRVAVSLAGSEAMDQNNLGAALAAQQRHDEAIACYERAIALNPEDPSFHFNLAATFHALGRWPEAERCYRTASEMAPGEPRYLAGLAAALRASGQDEQSLAAWLRVLQLAPNDLEALRNIGVIYHEHGQLVAAAQAHARAVESVPGEVEPLMYLGLVQLDIGDIDQALECFCACLAIEPLNPQARYNQALALERSGRLEEALEAYRQVPPGSHQLDLTGAQAGILEKLGEFAAAHALLEPMIESGTAGMRALDTYARLCRHFGECDQAIQRIEMYLQSGLANENDQRLLHFRVGELLDRQQRYDAAFRHYETGNRLKRYRYNAAEDERYVDRLIEVFSPRRYAWLPSAVPATDVTPIFIVGMPRSGTTLVEQILASHPEVQAGDELTFISRIANSTRNCNGQALGFPDYVCHLTQADCDAMARAYLDELRALAPGARYVTDKMPHNFPYLGLMHRLFPDAPIIHCLRDPADVCLSCYFQDFASYHNYAYDLVHLGQHYRQYRRTMLHFRDTLGVPMFEIQYESLVEDPETRSRLLVEYCGLPWDVRCLRFYESGRKSRTASYDQIRQPIYKRSAQRWRNYERYLQPLFDALGTTA
jgi:tetratricopeptide (TPR) repeat protein